MATSNNVISNGNITQIRFYGYGNENNFHEGGSDYWAAFNDPTSSRDFIQGITDKETGVLKYSYSPVIKLGIQTLPGVKFNFGNSLSAPIIIDHTGVYELDLQNTSTTITGLKFESESLNLISNTPNAGIIIDLLYKNSTGTVTS